MILQEKLKEAIHSGHYNMGGFDYGFDENLAVRAVLNVFQQYLEDPITIEKFQNTLGEYSITKDMVSNALQHLLIK